ncbi:hypothetical protein [Streptomyces decoyicus]|uniref:hypothetical protein n=1 Tax=Streptomyces decoyicus TaxID=249567 RepID=UPI00364F05B8
MARIGSQADLRAQVTSHPEFAEWKRTYAAAVADERLQHHQTHVRLDELEAFRAPRRAAVRRLNQLVGAELVCWDDFGPLGTSVHGWLASEGRLRIYLAGMECVGLLTRAQYSEALGCANTLGL